MMKSLFCTTAMVALTAHAHAQFAYDEAEQDVSDQVSACLEERGLPPDATSPFCPERDNRVLATITTFGDRNPEGAGAVSILDAETIASIAADHPAEVLNTLPGVNIHTNSGQEHLIAIRSPVLTGGAGQGSFLILEST